jgi:hypothetical protein
LVQGNAVAEDTRLGELLIAKRIKPAAQLAAADFKFKALWAPCLDGRALEPTAGKKQWARSGGAKRMTAVEENRSVKLKKATCGRKQ